MTPTSIIKGAAADGVTLALTPAGTIKAAGVQEAVDRWLPIIRQNKLGIVAALGDTEHDDPLPDASVGARLQRKPAESLTLSPLTSTERDRLLTLAQVWEMDAEEIAVMFRQCDRGGEGAGIRFNAMEARAFWFADADRVCGLH